MSGEVVMELSRADLADLRYAKSLLENPGLAARITNVLGIPVEKGFELLPRKAANVVHAATRNALQAALRLALATMRDSGPRPSSDVLHKLAVAATGAGGGAFGLLALPVELPLSTAVMLRSIADIARSQGERVKELDTKLACLEVFALGGRSRTDNAADTGYFAVRAALAKAVSEAAQYIAERGFAEEGAPAIVRLIAAISARFGATVSEKLAAQAVPVIGAAGGSIVNLLFIDHFQDMARGHFTVRRLERTCGREVVEEQYRNLPV